MDTEASAATPAAPASNSVTKAPATPQAAAPTAFPTVTPTVEPTDAPITAPASITQEVPPDYVPDDVIDQDADGVPDGVPDCFDTFHSTTGSACEPIKEITVLKGSSAYTRSATAATKALTGAATAARTIDASTKVTPHPTAFLAASPTAVAITALTKLPSPRVC